MVQPIPKWPGAELDGQKGVHSDLHCRKIAPYIQGQIYMVDDEPLGENDHHNLNPVLLNFVNEVIFKNY